MDKAEVPPVEPQKTSKERYRKMKRKFKLLVYENECYQEELRNLQRKLLKLSRDKNFLLDRLMQYEKVEDSSDDSDVELDETTDVSDSEEPTNSHTSKKSQAAKSRKQRLNSEASSESVNLHTPPKPPPRDTKRKSKKTKAELAAAELTRSPVKHAQLNSEKQQGNGPEVASGVFSATSISLPNRLSVSARDSPQKSTSTAPLLSGSDALVTNDNWRVPVCVPESAQTVVSGLEPESPAISGPMVKTQSNGSGLHVPTTDVDKSICK